MGLIRVADYIANFLYDDMGVEHVFMVTGGGAMFLNDGIAKHEKLVGVFNHHEQASAMAAVGYSKYKNSYAVAMTTSGCGATNAVTGLLDAWQDNSPVLFLSGQVKRKETMHNSKLSLRQLGVQEADIIPIVSSIAKYAVMVNSPEEIAYHLEKAAYLAKNGRPGPVWIDVPQDVQGATVDSSSLRHFDPNEIEQNFKISVEPPEIDFVSSLIACAKRPIVIAGNGVRLANSTDDLKVFADKFQIPVTTSYLGIDLLDNDDPLCIGRLGIKGDRAGNFAVQNSDLVIVLGSRLAVALTGFEYSMFAREAKIVVIDIDPVEHQKNTVKIDHFINCDVKSFLGGINTVSIDTVDRTEWIGKCQYWRDSWSVALKRYEDEPKINMYTFIDHVNRFLKPDTAVVADAGSAYYVTAQALKIRERQRYVTSGAQADMGFTLPASIGVAIAKNTGDVVAITGEGSFQMNIQELQTIVQNKLPIKIFIWNNNGYLSIRTTQRKFFDGRFMGTEPAYGISFPDVSKIAAAYGIPFVYAEDVRSLKEKLESVFTMEGPVLCEIVCPEDQEVIPTVSSAKRPDGTMVSKPTEDMYPFLDREEFLSQMIVRPLED